MTWRRWSDADKWFVIVTPRILREFLTFLEKCRAVAMAALQLFFALVGFWNTISLVFDTFNFKLFAAAQTSTLLISSACVLILADGTTRYVSSAYFTNEFPVGLRSAAMTFYKLDFCMHNNTYQITYQMRPHHGGRLARPLESNGLQQSMKWLIFMQFLQMTFEA